MQIKGNAFWIIAAGVGLGGIWRLMYKTGEHGGVFLILFLAMIALLGVWLMMAESAIGLSNSNDILASIRKVGSGVNWIGNIGLTGSLIMLANYSVIGGWSVFFAASSLDQSAGVTTLSPETLEQLFANLNSTVWLPLVFQFLFIAAVVYIVSLGFEFFVKLSKILFPVAVFLLLVAIGRALTLAGSQLTLDYIFLPDFSKITLSAVADAGIQAMVSLALGFGVFMSVGSYLDKKTRLQMRCPSAVLMVVAVSLVSALAFFPSLLTYGVKVDQGPMMAFTGMLQALSMVPINWLFSFTFYLMLFVFMLPAAIALFEAPVGFVCSRLKTSRLVSAIIVGAVVMLIGAIITLGFGPLKNIRIMGSDLFMIADFIATKIAIPISALGVCFICGFAFSKRTLFAKLVEPGYECKFTEFWYKIIRTAVPAIIAVVFLLGIIPFKLP